MAHLNPDRYLEQPDEVDTDYLADMADTRMEDRADQYRKGE